MRFNNKGENNAYTHSQAHGCLMKKVVMPTGSLQVVHHLTKPHFRPAWPHCCPNLATCDMAGSASPHHLFQTCIWAMWTTRNQIQPMHFLEMAGEGSLLQHILVAHYTPRVLLGTGTSQWRADTLLRLRTQPVNLKNNIVKIQNTPDSPGQCQRSCPSLVGPSLIQPDWPGS